MIKSAGRLPKPARAPNPPAANTARSRSVRNLSQTRSLINGAPALLFALSYRKRSKFNVVIAGRGATASLESVFQRPVFMGSGPRLWRSRNDNLRWLSADQPARKFVEKIKRLK